MALNSRCTWIWRGAWNVKFNKQTFFDFGSLVWKNSLQKKNEQRFKWMLNECATLIIPAVNFINILRTCFLYKILAPKITKPNKEGLKKLCNSTNTNHRFDWFITFLKCVSILTPSLPFIIFLQYIAKLTLQTYLEKSCSVCFRTKNASIKCWWNWALRGIHFKTTKIADAHSQRSKIGRIHSNSKLQTQNLILEIGRIQFPWSNLFKFALL